MKRSVLMMLAFALACVLAVPAYAQQPSPGGQGIDNLHASMQAAINTGNVNNLGLAWHIGTNEPVSHAAVYDNGRVYFADWGGMVYAADAKSGNVIWKKQVEQPEMEWPWHGFAGTGTIANGMLIEASVEGNAFGIDINTGDVKWQTHFAQDPQGGNIGHLLTNNGMVYIGLESVAEPLSKKRPEDKINFQGSVMALNVSNGNKVWERQLVQAPQNGVAVWGSFALDPEMNALFFGTGNNYTGNSTSMSDSVIAVNAQNGDVLWSHQLLANDVWVKDHPVGPDWDFGTGPQLFEANVNGQSRKLLGIGQKSGYYWALDRQNGGVVWNTVVGYGAVGGGMRGDSSVGNGTIFAWSNNNYADSNPQEHPMNVKALDTATGSIKWSDTGVQPAAGTSAGFLSNDVYFVGSLDGKIRGYRASDGQKVWESSSDQGAVASSLVVAGDTLFSGAGVPSAFGGTPATNGMFAYSLQGNAQQQPGQGQQPSQGQPQMGNISTACEGQSSANGGRFFPQTGCSMSGAFLNYWQTNGGLDVFGYPIGPEQQFNGMTIQPFERTIFELHPENQPPYNVLLSRVGVEALQQQGTDWWTFPKADPSAPHYFAETGHAIDPQFWNYWSSHGPNLGDPGTSFRESLALFGYPISQPMTMDGPNGETYTVQWFERARMEYHPNNPQPYQVLLGRLGAEIAANK